MKKHKILIYLSFGFLLTLIILIGYGYITEGKKEEEPINISLLVYGNDLERWTSLKQGVEQAEKDYNVVINYVTTSAEYAPVEQKDLIEREIANGAQGLLIAACDSKELEETVAELVQKVPILLIETGVNNMEEDQYLSADNYKMGQTLAETIMNDGANKGNVAILSQYSKRDSVVKRSYGFTDTWKGHSIITWNNSENIIPSQAEFQKMILDNHIDTVVALDNTSLENLVDLVEATQLNLAVYGIGNTDKVVSYLDKGVIRSIVFQNEFSIGYQGAELLNGKIANIPIGKTPAIAYRVINQDTMYTKENQRLLFPLVQ